MDKTKRNIKEIEEFVKFLKYNFNNHRKQVKTSEHISEIENSAACLKDYAEISEKIAATIKEYYATH